MFGIDLGITVSSVTLVTGDGKVLDFQILFGDKKDKTEWNRIVDMADALSDAVTTICKSHPGFYIEPSVSIEEPIYPYRTKNPRSYFITSCLYALIRNKLHKRGYKIYSVNPMSVKTTAKYTAFKKDGHIPDTLAVKGRLNKKGMIAAFKKLVGKEPEFHTIVGRETIADSYFIALTAQDRSKVIKE
jgi:hypothetical protein